MDMVLHCQDIYGINYIDNDEVIECKWFKTKQERNKEIESEVNND